MSLPFLCTFQSIIIHINYLSKREMIRAMGLFILNSVVSWFQNTAFCLH